MCALGIFLVAASSGLPGAEGFAVDNPYQKIKHDPFLFEVDSTCTNLALEGNTTFPQRDASLRTLDSKPDAGARPDSTTPTVVTPIRKPSLAGSVTRDGVPQQGRKRRELHEPPLRPHSSGHPEATSSRGAWPIAEPSSRIRIRASWQKPWRPP